MREDHLFLGFPGGSECKESICNAGDPDSIPWSGISPREGNGCQELDRTKWLILSLGASQVTLEVKNPPANARDKRWGWDPWVWKILCRRAWKPLQYSCLKNHMESLGSHGAWLGTVHMVAKSQTQLKRLKTHTHMHVYCPLPVYDVDHCSKAFVSALFT